LSSEPNVQPFPTLTPVDSASAAQRTDPEKAGPRWGLARRILFRFAFSYLLLYNLPFPLGYIPYVDAFILTPYSAFWSFLVPAVGDQVFGVDITARRANGSGDSTFGYVQVFCYLILALAATAVWTLLDRRRAQYERLHDWRSSCSRCTCC
jgi:hypothetical protein